MYRVIESYSENVISSKFTILAVTQMLLSKTLYTSIHTAKPSRFFSVQADILRKLGLVVDILDQM